MNNYLSRGKGNGKDVRRIGFKKKWFSGELKTWTTVTFFGQAWFLDIEPVVFMMSPEITFPFIFCLGSTVLPSISSSGYQANDKIKERRNGNNLIAAGEENGNVTSRLNGNHLWYRQVSSLNPIGRPLVVDFQVLISSSHPWNRNVSHGSQATNGHRETYSISQRMVQP